MYELEANEDNIKSTLKSDVLKRNECIFNILSLIYSIKSKATISIDGNWGTGKTFFVKQVEYVMNALNDNTVEVIEPDIKKIVEQMKNKMEEKEVNTIGNTRAVYFNASEYDSCEEPVLAIIADIIKNNPNIELDKPEIQENMKEKINKLLCSIKFGLTFQMPNGTAIGVELQKQRDDYCKSLINGIMVEKNIENIFKDILEELLVEKSNRLVVFIDELDRCNPKFAVKLFERIKNFFNDDRFIFVFSTNLYQLQHTIKKYYGNNFDASYYLQKFFDYQLELPEINIEDYINYNIRLIDFYSSNYFDCAVREIIKMRKFNLRDCNKYFELISLRYEELKKITKPLYYFFAGVLFPVLLAVKLKDFNEYCLIKSGNGIEEFKNILNYPEIHAILMDITKEQALFDKDLEDLYKFMFVNTDDNYKQIRKFTVRREYVQKMNNMLSYLGEKVVL